MKNKAILLILTAMLGACGQWPQVDAPAKDQTGEWPELLPMEALTALPSGPGTAQEEARRLAARASALQARARIMRTSVTNADAMDDLRARLAR